METFAITFTQRAVGLRNGWVEVVAPDEDAARRWARDTYQDFWSGIYPSGEHGPEYYPLGCLETVTVASHD